MFGRLLVACCLLLFDMVDRSAVAQTFARPATEAPAVIRLPEGDADWLQGESVQEVWIEDRPVDEFPAEVGPYESPGESRGGLSDLPGGERRAPVRASLFWAPSRPVQNVPGDLTLNGETLDLAAPLRLVPGDIWLATASVHRLEIGSDAILPDSGSRLPPQLWKITAGVMHFRDLDNGWKAGGIFNYGTASDDPFADARDRSATVIAFLNIPVRERDAWNFSLFYSNTGQLPFPIPGVAYVWRPDDTLTMNIGIPFSLDYRPDENWQFQAGYTPLTNVRTVARRRLGPAWSVYGGYEMVNDTYFLSDRTVDADRFYIFDQRLKLGLERDLGYGLRLDLSAAYLFDRTLFQSDKFSGVRTDELRVDPGLMGSLLISWSR